MNEYIKSEPTFLTTKEVLERYRLKSAVTLWNWRKKMNFPDPIHNGRFYSAAQIKKWDSVQISEVA